MPMADTDVIAVVAVIGMVTVVTRQHPPSAVTTTGEYENFANAPRWTRPR